MSATIIDGKAIAAEIKTEIAAEVQQMRDKGHRAPHLAAVLVGHDGGSETYVKNKVLACEACGFDSTLIRYEDSVTELELLERIRLMNEDEAIDGFIVQLPLPRHINEQRIIEAIDPRKDVEVDDRAILGVEAIILSMTPYERQHPEVLNGSRKERIAKGSGKTVQDVNRLIKQFDQTRKMMKMVSGGGMRQMMSRMPKGLPGMPKL